MKKVLCIIYPNFSLYEITALTSTLALSFDVTIDYVASDHSMVVSEDGLLDVYKRQDDGLYRSDSGC